MNKCMKKFTDKLINEGQAGFIILEPRSIFDAGIIGYDIKQNRLAYGFYKTLDSIIKSIIDARLENINTESLHYDDVYDEALDDLTYNTIGNLINMGETAPIFIYEAELD